MRTRGLKWIAATCAVAVTICATAGAASRIYSAAIEKPTPVIIIDAGHGGFDGGAVAPDGTNEKDINLAISLKLDALLTAMGYETVMIRTTDTAVDTEGSSIRERKRSDINNRFSIMKEHPDGIYLCIHQNCYGGSSSHGAQIFYTAQNADSQALAESIQTAIVEAVQTDNHRKIKPCTKDVYLIYHAPCRAVLVECGFLSNPTDLKSLKDESFQEKIAFAIIDGMNRAINNKEITEEQ